MLGSFLTAKGRENRRGSLAEDEKENRVDKPMLGIESGVFGNVPSVERIVISFHSSKHVLALAHLDRLNSFFLLDK